MKKKAILIFTLVFWVLAVCTLLSLRIEELMITKVVICQPESDGFGMGMSDSTLPADCLFSDEAGIHLYTAYEGNGWESGTRILEVPQENFAVEEDAISVTAYGDFVQYASKPPKVGGIAEVQRKGDKRDDTWLAVFPGGAPSLTGLPDRIALAERSDSALLLSVAEADQPFMADRAKSMVSPPEQSGGQEGSYYSLLDFESFSGALPQMALVLALMTFSLCLWGYSCFLAKKPGENRRFLLLNAGLGAVLLTVMAFLLGWIDLPSSLLPQNNILELGHYSREFGEIFSTLGDFASAGNQAAASALAAAGKAQACALLILLGGLLLAAMVIAAEAILQKRLAAPKGRHARQTKF